MSTADAVNTIAESLQETDEIPRKQIGEIVEVLGADASLALLAETRRVQDEGGLAVRDGTRKRTDGGVFFSLAKAQLPKADRNRIFRIRPPKSPESERREAAEAQASANAAAAVNGHVGGASVEVPRAEAARAVAQAAAQSQAAGRRRVVEVEVLRTFPKAQKEERPQIVAPRPNPAPAPRAEEPKREELRPLRRIITVAAPQEAPATPEAARDRMRALLKGLSVEDQRRVVGEFARELGVGGEASPARRDAGAEESSGMDDRTRERVLAAVTDALGLTSADLAQVLFGDDSPGPRSKARLALDRFRKSRSS